MFVFELVLLVEVELVLSSLDLFGEGEDEDAPGSDLVEVLVPPEVDAELLGSAELGDGVDLVVPEELDFNNFLLY